MEMAASIGFMPPNSTLVEFIIQQVYLPAIQQVFKVPRMSLGKNVRALREARGWTLEELAERSGVDLGTISALEIRGSLRSKFAGRLAAAFGVSLEQLLSEDPTTALAQPQPRETAQGASLDWPFQRVKPSEYASLTQADKDEVEGLVELKLKKVRPAKRPPPRPAAA